MIKTIRSTNEIDFDNEVNEFEAEHNVFATQTHYIHHIGGMPEFVAVIFYRSKQDYNKS